MRTNETNDPATIEWAKAQPVTVWVVYGQTIDIEWQVDLYLLGASRPEGK
jgi:hypothetical protein